MIEPIFKSIFSGFTSDDCLLSIEASKCGSHLTIFLDFCKMYWRDYKGWVWTVASHCELIDWAWLRI